MAVPLLQMSPAECEPVKAGLNAELMPVTKARVEVLASLWGMAPVTTLPHGGLMNAFPQTG